MLLLALAQVVIQGNLGAALTARLDLPFFSLAKSVGIEGAFQRVESVVAALWTLADLTMGGVLVFAIRAMGEGLAPGKKLAWLPWASVLAAAAGALIMPLMSGFAEVLGRKIVPMGNLILGLAVPALLWLLSKAGRSSTFSVSEGRKSGRYRGEMGAKEKDEKKMKKGVDKRG